MPVAGAHLPTTLRRGATHRCPTAHRAPTACSYYFQPATDPKHKNDWQLYFEGGGWCYDEQDCAGRSKGNL